MLKGRVCLVHLILISFEFAKAAKLFLESFTFENELMTPTIKVSTRLLLVKHCVQINITCKGYVDVYNAIVKVDINILESSF